MSQLDILTSFEYLYYGSTAIIHVLILSVRGPSLDCLYSLESDFCRLQILTKKDSFHAERFNKRILLIKKKKSHTNDVNVTLDILNRF